MKFSIITANPNGAENNKNMSHQKISDSQRNDQARKKLLIFVLGIALILVKCMMFHGFIYSGWHCDSLRTFVMFYGCSFAIAMAFYSFLFLFKSNWWTIVLQLIIDVWAVANMVYMRSNGLLLSFEDILLAGNMSGMWGSVISYLSPKMLLFPLLTVLYSIFVDIIGKTSTHSPLAFAICLLCSYIMVPISNFGQWKSNAYNAKLLVPYQNPMQKARDTFFAWWVARNEWESKYTYNKGVVNYFFAAGCFYITKQYCEKQLHMSVALTADEKSKLSSAISYDVVANRESDSDGNVVYDNIRRGELMLLLVESFESWAIEYVSENGQELMPNLRRFMSEQPVFYADKVKSQVKRGVSGDGQMLLNTGMMPCFDVAACMNYQDNVLPNLAHFYASSVTLNPCPGIWNQNGINSAYGIKELIEGEGFDDQWVLNELCERMDSLQQSTFIQAITIDSHAPFEKAKNIEYDVDPQMPTEMRDYIKCLHQLDILLKPFLDALRYHPEAVVVITGDHTIFKPLMLQENMSYILSHDIKIVDGKNYCPLIIKSPNIEQDCFFSDECYQMDLFPTILAAIGESDYWWRGFGINLLSPSSRLFTENEAYSLSDKLLKMDYFKGLSCSSN